VTKTVLFISQQQSSSSKTSTTSGSSGSRYGRLPVEYEDDYEDGPAPNRGWKLGLITRHCPTTIDTVAWQPPTIICCCLM